MYPVQEDSQPFSRFGVLLPITMLLLIPALGLVYVAKRFNIHLLFLGAGYLVIALIIFASTLIIVSGIYGAHERAKYRRLAGGINANAHRHPRHPRF